MDKEITQKILKEYWDSWFIPALSDFIRVPNLTPMVDPDYFKNGNLQKAIEVVD